MEEIMYKEKERCADWKRFGGFDIYQTFSTISLSTNSHRWDMTAASALYFLKKTAQNLAIIQDQELSGTAGISGIPCCALHYGDFKLMQMSDFLTITNYF